VKSGNIHQTVQMNHHGLGATQLPDHAYPGISLPICLYDGTDFVKGYPILSMKDGGKKNVETTVKDEQAPVSIYSRQFPSADKTLVLAAGAMSLTLPAVRPARLGFI